MIFFMQSSLSHDLVVLEQEASQGRCKRNMMLNVWMNVTADVLILLLLVFAFLDASAAFDGWAFRVVYKTSTATQSKMFHHTTYTSIQKREKSKSAHNYTAVDGLVM